MALETGILNTPKDENKGCINSFKQIQPLLLSHQELSNIYINTHENPEHPLEVHMPKSPYKMKQHCINYLLSFIQNIFLSFFKYNVVNCTMVKSNFSFNYSLYICQ